MPKLRLIRHEVDQRTAFSCPLCAGDNAEFWRCHNGSIIEGWCPACTNLRITQSALDLIKVRGKGHLLSSYLRDLPAVDGEDFECIDETNVERLADSVSEVPLVDRFDRLLYVLCERTPTFGSRSFFSYLMDWPLIRAVGPAEASAMVKALKADGLLVADGPDGIAVPPTPTRKAFDRYSELQKTGPMSQQAFVAMAFAPEYDAVWLSVIKPGILAAGYRPFRVDQKEHADKVDDLIIAEIRRSRFLVADFSGQRGGVYFEAGFAHGLARPVIWMCRDDEKDKLHFDTRQYNHILYLDHADAQSKLRNRIVAVVGEGTYNQSP